jgi:hypothetical protein
MPRAKTNVLFLSDGRPSDRVDERLLPSRLLGELTHVHEALTRTHTYLESFQVCHNPRPNPRPNPTLTQPVRSTTRRVPLSLPWLLITVARGAYDVAAPGLWRG